MKVDVKSDLEKVGLAGLVIYKEHQEKKETALCSTCNFPGFTDLKR